MFYCHGRFQVPKFRSKCEDFEDWLNRGMGRQDLRINPFQEDGNDEIQPNSRFYSTMVVHGIPNDDPHMMIHKDRAWKFKRNSIEFHMLGDTRKIGRAHV